MNPETTVHTIGFTKKTAAEFFGLLHNSGTKRIVDVRLNNVSQLAGFSKRDDLQYFLKEIAARIYPKTATQPCQRLAKSVRILKSLLVPLAGLLAPPQHPSTMSNHSLEAAVEFAENPESRCPCVLLLDVSGSMKGAPRLWLILRRAKHK